MYAAEVDIAQVKVDMLELGKFGQCTDGGITRLAFSEEYRQAALCLQKKMRQAGLSTRIDPIGNVIGELPGEIHRPYVWIGSHLDTVTKGGLFDGLLGIAAGLEVVRMVQRSGHTLHRGIRLIAFQAEEGSKLGGTFGSRAMMGMINDTSPGMEEILSHYNLTLEDIKNSRLLPRPGEQYLEMHIEQGGTLDQLKIPLGVVTGIVGIHRYELVFHGESNHAGTTDMNVRKDAWVMRVQFILEFNKWVCGERIHTVATIGQVEIKPNMPNVIPGLVRASLEVRSMDNRKIPSLIQRAKSFCKEQFNSEVEFICISEKESTPCSTELQEQLAKACSSLQYPYIHLPSGAGHDANAVAHRIPVGMLFVPSKGGKSHCPQEDTDWNDIKKGIQVLYYTLLALEER